MNEIKIIDTAYGGSGIGKDSNGKTIFIPFTVTGDIVKAEIVEDKGSYSIAKLIEILEPSQHRTTPHCTYHGICGGCQFGHINYEYQQEIKINIVKQALRNYPHTIPEIKIFTNNNLNYRIRSTIRIKNGQTGFYAHNTEDFVPVTNCPIMKESLFAKCAEWAHAHVQDETIALSVIENTQGESIALVEGKNLATINSCKPFNGIKHEKIQSGFEFLPYTTTSGVVPVGYGGFFQSNQFLNNQFQEYATNLVTSDSVLELYAGGGFFTSALVKKSKLVIGVESNATAVRLGKKIGYPLFTQDVFQFMKHNKQTYSCIFVDPPRDGVDKKTLASIENLSPKQIIYVSCDPMTLARDINRLSQTYKIENIAIFDMYPHTYHVEIVVQLQLV